MIRITAMMLPMMALVVMAPAVSAAGSVPEGYRQVAEIHGIPSTLFYAVALAESGKRIDGLRTLRPWPWTLNVHGDGRFYPSRRAAMAALQEALASGRSEHGQIARGENALFRSSYVMVVKDPPRTT